MTYSRRLSGKKGLSMKYLFQLLTKLKVNNGIIKRLQMRRTINYFGGEDIYIVELEVKD